MRADQANARDGRPHRRTVPSRRRVTRSPSRAAGHPACSQRLAFVRGLDSSDRNRLRPAVALLDVELNPLAFFKAAVAVRLDGGEVDEDVPTTVDRDEAVALVRVEPFDGALSHYSTP